MWEKLKRFFAKEEDQLTEQQKAVFNLQRLQQEHCFLDVRFPTKGDEFYQSLVLEVWPEKNQLLIDELYPKHMVPTVKDGDIIEITSRRKSMRLSFVTSICKGGIQDDATLKLEMPEYVLSRQQRSHFRVAVGMDAGIKLHVYDDGEMLCSVVNISNDGIGFYMPGDQVKALEKMRMFADCAIELPDHSQLNCSLEFRSIEVKNKPQQRTVIGAKITEITAMDQKKLDQYIASLQRAQRQRELRTR